MKRLATLYHTWHLSSGRGNDDGGGGGRHAAETAARPAKPRFSLVSGI